MRRKKITVLLIMSMLLQLLVSVAPVMAEDSSDLKPEGPESVPLLAVTLSPGETTGATAATVTDYVYGNLIVNVTEEEITTPQVGDAAPAAGDNLLADYESGADITTGVAVGKYLQIYDVDMGEEARIVAFYQVKLTEEDIKEINMEEEPPEEPAEAPVEDPAEEPVEDIEEDIVKEEPAGAMRMFSMPMSSGDVVGTYALGPSVTGTLYSDGAFEVSGSGPMNNYSSYSLVPFASNRSSITSVVINSGVTTIGNNMFCTCDNIISVDIPDSVESIGDYAFRSYNGASLTTVNISESAKVTSIGAYAFHLCNALTSITIPDSVESIGDYAFRYCSSLTSITIPDAVTRIGDYAFAKCSDLTSVSISESAKLTYIGIHAFDECTSLASITIPDSVDSIGYYAFAYCPLESITIPALVSCIDDCTFGYCSALTSVTIPNSVTLIDQSAFFGCSALTSVTIPNSVEKIHNTAFANCSALTSVTIPASVNTIGYRTFGDCSGLASVTTSATSIGWRAFQGCSSLASITNLYEGNQSIAAETLPSGVPNPKTARAYSANTGFITAAEAVGYDIKYLDSIVITADDGTWTYDGQPHSKATFTTTGLPEGYTVEAVISESITNVGTKDNVVESYIIKFGDEDVTAQFTNVSTEKGTLTITKRPLEITAKDASKTYDGTELTNNGWDITSGTLAAGDEPVVTVVGNRTNAGTVTNEITAVGVMHDGTTDVTENYNITTQNGTLTVTARPLEITAASASKPYDGSPLINTGYSRTSGSLAAGQTLDSVTVTGSQLYPGSSSNTAGGAMIKDAGGNNVTGNYAITYVNGTLGVTVAEIEITVTANSDSKEYDGTPLINNGWDLTSGTLAAGDSLVVTVVGSRTDAGTAANAITEVKVMHGTTEVTENYDITEVNGTLTVTARPLEITAASASKPYDGSPLINTGYSRTSGSLAAGQTLDSVTVTGSQLYPGSSANTASGAVIKDTGGTDVTGNYDITYAAGTLTVTKAAIAITVTANSDSRVYDGTPLTNNGGVLTGGTLATGDSLEVTATGIITDVGTAANTVTDVRVKHGTTDVTENYNITIVAGTLTIEKRPLQITAASDSKPYDGTALTDTGYSITSGSLAVGQTLDSVTVTGTQLYPGSSTNAASGAVITDASDNDVTGNYAITYVNGTLEVTAAEIEITVTAKSDSKKYDGTELTNNGWDLTSGTLAAGDRLEVTVVGSITDVGTAENKITLVKVINGTTDVTGNYDITCVDGTLVINRKSRSREDATSTQPVSPQKSVIVIVNGKEHDAGKETRTTEDAKSTIIIEVNNQAIASKINEAIRNNPIGTGNAIQVPVADTNSQVAKVELTGDIVKKLEENTFDVSVKRDDVEYIIPAEEFTISQVAENLGVSEKDLKDIKVEVKITKPDDTVVARYNEVVKAKGAELVFPPVEFGITAKTTKSDDTTGEVEISNFSIYVERVMEIPVGVDPGKITTGIVFNPDGTYSHVPTAIYQKDGKWFAKLNSLTNSAYSIIWNPISVKSVENHWAKETVNDMAARLVIFNPEAFEPAKAITRADFAEYIVRALGLYREDSGSENKFTDVQNSGARTKAILIATEYGIVSGYPDDTFRPGQQITREEAMAMLQRAMQVTKLTGSDQDRYQSFTDFAQVSSWAEEPVKAALAAHVFNGTSATTISPKANLTYAETAQAIKNLLVESKLINQ